MLRNVTLIRAVSSCWKSRTGSAEAALSPDDILCLPALGLAGGAEIRKKNISLISDNSLKKKKNQQTTTSEVFCCCWALPFNLFDFFFSPVKELNYFLIIEEEVIPVAAGQLLKLLQTVFMSQKFGLDVTKLCCCKDIFGSRSLQYHSVDGRKEKILT